MRLFGGYLPFIGWKEYDEGTVEALAEYIEEVDAGRRYAGFHIGWLEYWAVFGLADRGPREYTRDI